MGKNSQRRRAARKRQGQRGADRAGRGRHARSQTGPPRQPPPVEALVQAAVWSWDTDPSVHEELLTRLDSHASRGDPVLAHVDRLLRAAVGRLWACGWTPADVAHMTARRLSPAHVDVVAGVVVRDGRRRVQSGQALHPRWREQLDALETRPATGRSARPESSVRLAVTVLCLLERCSPLPPTVPGPGSPAEAALRDVTGLDQRVLARVRGLLAKAESTEFDEEAEALTAKAQELIARHAIADALLHTPDDLGEPSVRRLPVDAPYEDAKATLVVQIATANRCRAVQSPDLGWITVFGYDRDLDAVELLAASLLAQATGAMARHGSRRDAYGRSTTRSFRRSFLFGFALRVGERLRAATDGQVAGAAPSERGRLLPVLAARDDRVRAAQDAAFPRTVNRTRSISNPAGWVAGQAAGSVAELGVSAGRLADGPAPAP